MTRAAAGIALVATGLTLAACGSRGVNGAPALGFARMIEQPRYDPYEGTVWFSDGRTMRPPPPGTVPREGGEWDTLLVTDPIAAARLAQASTPRTEARGASRFGIYCAVCHGERADGQSVVAHNMVDHPPPSLLTPAMVALTPATMYAVVTRGVGHMPGYAADLSTTDRWAVIAYLRILQADETREPAAAHDTTATGEPNP